MAIAQRKSEHLDQQAHSTSGNLIAADKVEGTDVYNRAGEELGTVDHIMIDKISGKVVYAIMSFGGVLGLGESSQPPDRKVARAGNGAGDFIRGDSS
jgi:hypothetical protein